MDALKFWAFDSGGGGAPLGEQGPWTGTWRERGGVVRWASQAGCSAAGHPLRAAGRWRFTCTGLSQPAAAAALLRAVLGGRLASRASAGQLTAQCGTAPPATLLSAARLLVPRHHGWAHGQWNSSKSVQVSPHLVPGSSWGWEGQWGTALQGLT